MSYDAWKTRSPDDSEGDAPEPETIDDALEYWMRRAEAAERREREARAEVGRLKEALDTRCLFINPYIMEQAADAIDCNSDGACSKTWHEWDTNAGGCHASERGDYCPNDVAETLRALAKVARATLAGKTEETAL